MGGFRVASGGIDGNLLKGGFMHSIYLESADTTASKKRHTSMMKLFEDSGFSIDYQQNMQAWY